MEEEFVEPILTTNEDRFVLLPIEHPDIFELRNFR